MSDNDNSWVFDSLICFLNGPIWNAPLQSFIEEKSLIFDVGIADENEYRKIFEEFKNMVDFMLDNFMEDIGITSEQFEEACNYENHGPIPMKFDQNLFEQIWAANDYEIFKRLMTQKNVELQLQALELLEQKYGITPESFKPQKQEKETVDTVITKHLTATHSSTSDVNKQTENITEHDEKPFQPSNIKQNSVGTSENTKTKMLKIEPDATEIQKRQDYLRQQRDKLVALKKETRRKELDVEINENQSQVRPKSAKAAKKILKGEVTGKMDTKQMQIRRTLAERLKDKIVNNKK